MKQIKEMWNLIFDEWMGNGKKMIIGAIFLAVGMIGQCLSSKTLSPVPFALMASGMMCFVNALFSKVSEHNINLLMYLVINIVLMEIGLVAAAMDYEDNTIRYVIWAGCFAGAWILQAMLLQIKEGPKRAVLSFFETLLSLLAMAVPFFGTILLDAVL